MIYEVVIAGGSHAGLALALALDTLADGGVRVAIVERSATADAARPASTDPRAFALAAASVNLLRAIGVWPALATEAQPITSIEITDTPLDHSSRPVLLSYENTVHGDTPATWMVEAERLRAGLLAEVARRPSLSLFAGSAVAGYSSDAATITLRREAGDGVGARLLVAADGAASPVRTLAGIRTVAWGYDQVGIVTTIAHERAHEGCAVQHFLPAGPFAILPLVGNRSCITWSEGRARASEIMALDDPGFLAEVDRRFGYRLGEIRLDADRRSWPLSFHFARTLHAPRLVLVGDAARSVHPIAGQGVNLAFRDVAALAEVLFDGMSVGLEVGDGTLLERYAQWRRFDSSMSAAAFGTLNRLFSNDSPLLRAIRGLGMSAVDALPGLKQMLVAEAAGLTGEVPRLMQAELPASATPARP